jgi:exosortase
LTQLPSQLPIRRWLLAVWISILLLLCYFSVLHKLVLYWATDPDMGRGFLVPLVSGFIVWQRRDILRATPRNPNLWGLVVVAFAGVLELVATLGAELFTARLAFIMSVAGIILYLGGTNWLKALAFPCFLLLFMIPIPQIVYARLTLRLQIVASELAEWLISLVGIPVIRTGNILELPHQTLNVVEACSGIRSLLSLSFLSLVYGYFTDKRTWMRWALLGVTIPIAIAANAIRVTLTGLLTQVDAMLAEGVYHQVEGYLVFVIALAALVACHNLISTSALRISARLG